MKFIHHQVDAASYIVFGGIEPIIREMLVETEFVSAQNSCDDRQLLFSASAMEVKLVSFSQGGNNGNSVDGFHLAFFLNSCLHLGSGIFSPSVRSFPFGRIIEGWKVIETLIQLSQDERNNVMVTAGFRTGLLN